MGCGTPDRLQLGAHSDQPSRLHVGMRHGVGGKQRDSGPLAALPIPDRLGIIDFLRSL
jgi:hypothetical protein